MPSGIHPRVFLTQLRQFSEDCSANFALVRRSLRSLRQKPERTDILVLPELVGGDSTRSEYERFAHELATEFQCHVVAGSHHGERQGGRVNCGLVAAPDGEFLAVYEKLRPYGIESKVGVIPGKQTGQFTVGRCRVLVLICADFWYSEVFLRRLKPRPDLILVPTFSISSRASPHAARSLWRSMAVSRAYEFGVYVGVSDWAYPSEYHQLKSSSVAGLADPRPRNHNGFFTELGRVSVRSFAVDLERLRELREHRSTHTFLADERLTGNFSPE